MKSRLLLLFLALTPLLSNADTSYVGCTELQETSNPAYYLSTLRVSEASLPFNRADPAKSRAATYVQKKLQEKTQQELICHEFQGAAEKTDSPEADSNTFTTWHFKDQQIDLKTVVADYQTIKQLASDAGIELASLAGFDKNNSSIPFATGNNDLASAPLASGASRPQMHLMVIGLTGAGLLAHGFGYQEAALLFSTMSLIGASKTLSYIVISGAIAYMSYSIFIAKFYNFAGYIREDSSNGYYIANEELYNTLSEKDFEHFNPGIWKNYGTEINRVYGNVFQEFKTQLNGGDKHYGSWIHEGRARLIDAVIPDYHRLMGQHEPWMEIDLTSVSANSALSGFGLILRQLTNFPSLGLAAATVTQETLNYGLDYYCGGYWEEECLGFWNYNEWKDLSSPTNMKYAAKRVATRHLLPTMTVVFFAMKAVLGR